MDTLGPYLRSAREAKGMDLRDAAQQTRISINYLKAIEEEDFSKLPGEVFVKGFLKSYARFLQLNEEEVMVLYAGLIKPAAPASAQKNEKQKGNAAQQQPPAEPENTVRTSLEPYLWGGIGVIALVALLLIVIPERHAARKELLPAVSGSTSTTPLATAATATVMPEKLYLDIIALEDVWILVRTDSSPQKKAVLKKGEAITWSADARFLVSYGSIGAAKLVLNGKELAVTGPKSAVVRDLIITSAGIAFQKFEAEKPRPAKPKLAARPTPTVQMPAPAPVAPTPAAPMPEPAPKPAPPAAPLGPILSPQE
jgi:cytoskeletal protein RodZ